MLVAASLGMPTTATMMFGSRETPEQIVEHLFRVREIQAEGGSFTAFIPWTYQPGNTELGGSSATGVEYLKVLALSRIILDNIPNIQASWVTQGAKLAQVALFLGQMTWVVPCWRKMLLLLPVAVSVCRRRRWSI